MLTDFKGEVWANALPEVLQEFNKANATHDDDGYGKDIYSKKVLKLLQKEFVKTIDCTFAVNGTAANIIALKSMLDRFSSIICTRQTHVNTYEAGAFEYTLGNKILTCDSKNAKISPELIEQTIEMNKVYDLLPKVVVLSQPTELGTVYTNQELKNICDCAHKNNLFVYLDGARISMAIDNQKTTLKEMLEDTGIDVFSFGGTKIGAMFGEVIVYLNRTFANNLSYITKQSMQHFPKSKFLACQLYALLKNNLWKTSGKFANEMAKKLEKVFKEKGYKLAYPCESNCVFVYLDEKTLNKIQKTYALDYWYKEQKIVRFATSYNTTEEQINNLKVYL